MNAEKEYTGRQKEKIYIIDESGHTKGYRFQDAAVIINLYYIGGIEKYIRYMEEIPEEIPVYVFSSQEKVLEIVRMNGKRENLYCYGKPNRGRDISALLVAARSITDRYDRICFLHDKSANTEYLKSDVEEWTESLWKNTIGSLEFIRGVLEIFEKEKDIGLLLPPQPYGEFYSDWYWDPWRQRFAQMEELAGRFHVQLKKEEPVSIGTMFWARTAALKKLLNYPWTYEVFPEEPMPMDGTISHAIERSLGFVALDAGYRVGTIMEKKYAERLLLRTQKDMRMMFWHLHKKEHIFNMFQLRNLEQWEHDVRRFCKEKKDIYIYMEQVIMG